MIHHALFSAVSERFSTLLEKEASDLEEIGKMLIRSRTPWTSTPDFSRYTMQWICEGPRPSGPAPGQPATLPAGALFAAVCLVATAIEATEGLKGSGAVLERIALPDANWGVLASLKGVLTARVNPRQRKDVEAELASAPFTEEQSQFVLRWSTRELHFLRHHGKRALA